MSTTAVHLFSNGEEYYMWQSRNCRDCIKYDPEQVGSCDLDTAILTAMFGDGTVTGVIAYRLGYRRENSDPTVWRCRERKTDVDPAAHEMARAGAEMLPGFDAPEPRAAGGGAS